MSNYAAFVPFLCTLLFKDSVSVTGICPARLDQLPLYSIC